MRYAYIDYLALYRKSLLTLIQKTLNYIPRNTQKPEWKMAMVPKTK